MVSASLFAQASPTLGSLPFPASVTSISSPLPYSPTEGVGTGCLHRRVYTVLIDMCMYVHVSVRICVRVWVYVQVCRCVYTCALCVHAYMCSCIHVCVHLFLSVRNNIMLKIHPKFHSNSPVVNLIPDILNFGITESIQTQRIMSQCDFIPL